MANIETGNNTANVANIDANYDLLTSTPQVNTRYSGATGAPNYVGATKLYYENDSGILTGTPLLQSPMTTLEQNISVGQMTPMFDYAFNGSAQDTGQWYFVAASAMSAAVGGGFLTLNNNSTATSGAGVVMRSSRYFPITANAGLRVGAVININTAALANENWYFGLGVPGGAATIPTDGVWFSYSSAGLVGNIAFNGTPTSTGALPVGHSLTLSSSTNVNLGIRIYDMMTYFFYNGNVIGSIATPTSQGTPFMTTALPIFFQYVNNGTVVGTPQMQMKVAATFVDQLDSSITKPYSHIQASKGLMAYQTWQGTAVGAITAYFPNNQAPSANLPTNTTVAGSQIGLGGQSTWTVTPAAGTDLLISSYLNPVTAVNVTPRILYITGIRIQSIVWTLITTNPLMVGYSLCFGTTTQTLVTSETASFTTATAKAARRLALGQEMFAASAAVGTSSATGPVFMQFQSPVVVNPGEYISVVAKGLETAPGAGALCTLITYDGYAE